MPTAVETGRDQGETIGHGKLVCDRILAAEWSQRRVATAMPEQGGGWHEFCGY
jgi:hypothetical protein